jgi:hypothetical protein
MPETNVNGQTEFERPVEETMTIRKALMKSETEGLSLRPQLQILENHQEQEVKRRLIHQWIIALAMARRAINSKSSNL